MSGRDDKRLLGLGLLVAVAVVGAGVGTIGLTGDSPPDRPDAEGTAAPTEPRPTGTPEGIGTVSGGSASPPPSALLSETPSDGRPDNGTAGNATGG
ncbi:hypothetical protein [Haloarcula brevis]|uniref:hypothetical protein n=1 Tax=Haloarcula brevis TaxID=3111453 RepID=UPI00300E8479